MEKIIITGDALTLGDVVKVACQNARVELGSLEKVRRSLDFINRKLAENAIIYGVTTGFGAKADQIISREDAKELQINLLRSHATGVGKNFPRRMVRAIMLIRLNTLVKGYSGVKVDTLERLRDFLNYQIHPLVPEQGSLGASGDLCPLSHLALPLIGEGYVEYDGAEYKTAEFLARLKADEFSGLKDAKERLLQPFELSYKEGLALNNGTTVMAALGTFAVYEFERMLKLATLASSLVLEAFCARRNAFDEKIHAVRNHAEQAEIARWIRKFTENSSFLGISQEALRAKSKTAGVKIEESDAVEKKKDFAERLSGLKCKPQDSYSLRCTPQVFGASLQALNHAKAIFAGELNAAVDNPLIFADEDEVISGGNFHGQPLALALDYLKIAIAEVGNLVERQINKLLDKATNDLLEPFLVYDEKNINSGLMIPHYVAASLVSENKVLAHPASVDSIPTSANTEDHVSMGATAGRQALQILENVKNVVVIGVLTAHHAAEIRRRQFAEFALETRMGKATGELFDEVKTAVPDFRREDFLNNDRFLFDDIKRLAESYDDFVAVAERNLEE
ncbi:MAG: aromatic amino acid lyase [Acidobacteriota bacterium]|nr:aromatic amino acid lyase [Acidobacteriota bacterium]